MADVVDSNTEDQAIQPNKGLFLVIHNKEKDKYYNPVVKDGVTVDWSWKGAAGKASFSVYNDALLEFEEGDEVFIKYDETKFFKGFVFTRGRDKDGWINVTAYDQLRYFKNKEVYIFIGKTASEIIKAIASDLQLNIGEIADTNYVIPKYRGSNTTIFDIVQDVLDMTTENETDENENKALRLFSMYDDFGALTVKPLEDMQTNLLIDDATAQNFRYESTIDKDTYNQIQFYYDDKDTGTRVKRRYPEESASENIKRWGILRLTENINPKKPLNYEEMIKKKLAYYNRVRRSLTINNAFGDCRIRGGSMLYVRLDLGDMMLEKQMIVSHVTHKFTDNIHLMDLELRGDVITG